MLNKKKNNKGFTLVELLVVIAIIGILAVISVPALLKNIDKAKSADIVSEFNLIKSASISYYSDHGTFASDAPSLISSGYIDDLDASKYTLSATTTSGVGTLIFTAEGANKGTVLSRVKEAIGTGTGTTVVSGTTDETDIVITITIK